MESKVIWNRIVEQHQKNLDKQENVVQKEWESIFTVLGYNSFFGEIDAHRTIHIGSGKTTIPDIIIKNDDVDLFDVELKQYSYPFDAKMEEQLLSYMKLLEIAVGVLVCKELYVYVYAEKNIKKRRIDFTEDNPDGIKFIDLFKRGAFSKKEIEAFIDSRNKIEDNIKKIKNEVTDELVKDLVITHLQASYSIEEINAALQNISITVDSTTKNSDDDGTRAYRGDDIYDDIYSEPNFDYVIIKTSDKWVNIRGSLYDATRGEWNAGKKITQYTFVLSVINTIVKAVYIVDRWHWVQEKGRWEFFGKEATGPEFDKIIGKRIPEKYRKRGMASPVVYKDYDLK